jgi:transposase
MDSRSLPKDVDGLKALVASLAEAHQREIDARDLRIQQLERENRLLRRELFAPKSERRPHGGVELSLGQMALLFPELLEAAERLADERGVSGSVELSKLGSARVPKRRKQFPAHLPVMRTTYELPEVERVCSCGATMERMGENVTKELERLEISVVHEIARTKYACKVCQCGVRIAPGPDRVIDKGILGVGFLAHLLVERFGRHMPYNRLEAKYASEGFDLSRSVLCSSAVRCAEILEPIARQILADALASGVVQTDDTPVTIQQDGGRGSRIGRTWVYRGLGGEVYFDVTENRSRDGPSAVLKGFRGYLQADAYAVYDAFFRGGDIVEVGCWAHARRYFVQAEATEPALAKVALARIAELYAIERHLREKGCGPEEIRKVRMAESRPRLRQLLDWMEVTLPTLLPRGEMAKAIDYALANWTALCRFCEDGRLFIDNNPAERALRSVAVGRKNWLFYGNERGGQAAATMYSLIATCKEHGVDPRMYLRDVLLRIAKVSDVRDLTPYGWKARWQKVVEDHRASILERLALRADI